MLFVVVYVLGMFLLKYLALGQSENHGLYAVFSQMLVFALIVSYIILMIKMFRGMRKLRAEERLFHPESFLDEVDKIDSKQREYKSNFCVAGIPLFHFRFGMPEKNDKPVIGWMAGGDIAYGLIFAWGGLAVAPISVGIVAVGALSVGAVSLGLLALGTVAIGVVGFGASAIAYKAYASLSSLGWESAFSVGFSVAKEAAIGPIAFADQINNERAAEISNLAFFSETYTWALFLIAVLVIIPAIWHSNKVRQRMRKH